VSAAAQCMRPIPGAGPNEIVALKQSFAVCGEIRIDHRSLPT